MLELENWIINIVQRMLQHLMLLLCLKTLGQTFFPPPYAHFNVLNFGIVWINSLGFAVVAVYFLYTYFFNNFIIKFTTLIWVPIVVQMPLTKCTSLRDCSSGLLLFRLFQCDLFSVFALFDSAKKWSCYEFSCFNSLWYVLLLVRFLFFDFISYIYLLFVKYIPIQRYYWTK